ncbi:hypothetical protein [Actinoalloteichus hymeniacidonis]|uniref:Uncharacterized protein n=1 Tax=Actinoalloteichus hymeniacidonis TaxID=340345 RepID=A0AAC9HKP4_9PSEU|nr:hypothetical protein [Actinoalloteichus hymeniacidonis]AOS60911.1 hypothetical protein TL08_00310 [Actinoalloteichus hymeniacidonis]MBB5911089.1 hypothetical protein [Actinoalloteichus hymeniacidonis]
MASAELHATQDDPGRTTARDSAALSVLGAVGVVLVLYSYLVAVWPSRQGETFGVVSLLRRWVNEPMGIGSDFGFLGTALIFLIAGYLGARSMDVEPLGRFVLRLLVTFAALALVTSGLVFLAGLAGGEAYRGSGLELGPDPSSGYFLLIISLFVLSALLCRPLARIHPAWAVAAQIVVSSVPVFLGAGAEGLPRSLSLQFAFLPILIIGQLAWSVRTARMPLWLAVVLGMAAFQVMAWAERSYHELLPWWYPLSAVFAMLFFLLLLNHPPRFGLHAVFGWLFDRRYPALLFTVTLGWATLSLLGPVVPTGLAVLASLLITLAAADGYHRLIEKPLRRLLVRGRPPQGA